MVDEDEFSEPSYLQKLKNRRRDLEALILMLESNRYTGRSQEQLVQRKDELRLLSRQIGILEMVEGR